MISYTVWTSDGKNPASWPPGGHLRIDLSRKNQVLPEKNSILEGKVRRNDCQLPSENLLSVSLWLEGCKEALKCAF